MKIFGFTITRSEAEKPIVPPTPYELAMRFGAALLASNRFGDDFGAAMAQAWAAVPEYYAGELTYRSILEAKWYAANASPVEGHVAGVPGEINYGYMSDIHAGAV